MGDEPCFANATATIQNEKLGTTPPMHLIKQAKFHLAANKVHKTSRKYA
jgi:hypothetical protein